jgi:para-aminobenzoate synthetase
MEILDAHEGRPRGIYSGSLGFISFNDTFDLNIVIRTAVVQQGSAASDPSPAPDPSPAAEASPSQPPPTGLPHGTGRASAASGSGGRGAPNSSYPLEGDVPPEGWISIGAGGAIVVQSDTGAEYEEMRLKARALMRAVGACDGLEGPAAVDECGAAYGFGCS